jgi:hypothetical protein
MNFDPAYNNSEIIEEQLRQWSVNDHIPFYRSNRQVAIRALMDQEESSNHELERKLFDERRSRELAEANLLYEQIRCQEWGSAYDTCVNQLSSQRGEIELLQAEIAYLKETSLPVSSLRENLNFKTD